VDANVDRAAGIEIGDARARPEWERGVRGGETVLVVDLAAGGGVTVKSRPVPRRDTGLWASRLRRRWRPQPTARGDEGHDESNRAPDSFVPSTNSTNPDRV